MKQKTRKRASAKNHPVKREQSIGKEVTPDKAIIDDDRAGRCPVCQMPFSLLSVIESPTWHVNTCLTSPDKVKEGNLVFSANTVVGSDICTGVVNRLLADNSSLNYNE